MDESGTHLPAIYVISIHIILHQSASWNVMILPYFFFSNGEAQQLPLRLTGFKHDVKVHHLPSAMCQNVINDQFEEDAKTTIRKYLLA